jgi:uncharacterized protein (DUF362 family)
MCLDLNRCLYYSRPEGPALDADEPVRVVLSVIDGIVGGEGEGPLAPSDRPLGAVIASLDPVAADLAAIALMGFDENRIPKVREAMDAAELRVTQVRSAADVRVSRVDATTFEAESLGIDALRSAESFTPHSGWRDHLERTPCAA